MEFNRTLRIGTRRSPLALKQVEEVLDCLRRFYPNIKAEIVGIDTYGDRDKTTPISDIEGTDFFTREIDEALLKGQIDPSTMLGANGEPSSRIIDFAVHSAKDLPDEIPNGLTIAAITESIDPYDALVLRQSSTPTLGIVEGLVSKENLRIDSLREGARIGASSQRRKTQLKKYRDDFQIVDIRGNIEERLERLDKDGLDAIVIAACALTRLGLEDRIAQRIPFEILTPHPLQGSLAIVTREDDLRLIEFLSRIDNREKVLV